MRASAVAGLVLANSNDELLNELTSVRSMASVPFGGRYRLIDFTLSNLVHAGVSSVGLITKENYHSLMDHIGNGFYWDLDRKGGGIYLLPPYATSGVRRYTGTIDALYGAMNFLKRTKAEYIVISGSETIANIDISSAIESHINNQADITVVYHYGKKPVNHDDIIILDLDGNNKINSVTFKSDDEEVNYGIETAIIGKELLKKLIKEAYDNGGENFNRDIIAAYVDKLNIYGYEHKEFVAVLDGMRSYIETNMDLLKTEVRRQLFKKERPVLTKTRDDMPTRYGTKSVVNNCFIADGCIIDGTVENSILSRGVKIEKGAVVKNCILMQEATVGANAVLENVIADKNAVIGDGMTVKGTKEKSFFIDKNQVL